MDGQYTVLSSPEEISAQAGQMLEMVPSLCRNSPGLQSRPKITKKWMKALLQRASAVVLHGTKGARRRSGGQAKIGSLDGVAIVLAISPKRAHIEILCAANDDIDAGVQVRAQQWARQQNMDSVSIALDRHSVALAETMPLIEEMAKIIYDHREALRKHFPDLAERISKNLVSRVDADLLYELLRHTYDFSQPGGPETATPWPARKLEDLANQINAARSRFHALEAKKLEEIRASLGEVQDQLQALVRRDGEYATQAFLQDRRVHLSPEQIANAIAYEMRRIFRAPGGAGPCTDWFRYCANHSECPPEGKQYCDGDKVIALMRKIMEAAKKSKYGKPVIERIGTMANMFWMRADSRFQRKPNGKYLRALLNMLEHAE